MKRERTEINLAQYIPKLLELQPCRFHSTGTHHNSPRLRHLLYLWSMSSVCPSHVGIAPATHFHVLDDAGACFVVIRKLLTIVGKCTRRPVRGMSMSVSVLIPRPVSEATSHRLSIDNVCNSEIVNTITVRRCHPRTASPTAPP